MTSALPLFIHSDRWLLYKEHTSKVSRLAIQKGDGHVQPVSFCRPLARISQRLRSFVTNLECHEPISFLSVGSIIQDLTTSKAFEFQILPKPMAFVTQCTAGNLRLMFMSLILWQINDYKCPSMIRCSSRTKKQQCTRVSSVHASHNGFKIRVQSLILNFLKVLANDRVPYTACNYFMM